MVTFQCHYGYLKYYNFLKCPNWERPLHYPVIIWLSGALLLFYSVGILTSFYRLIRKDTGVIEEDCGCLMTDENLKVLKRNYRFAKRIGDVFTKNMLRKEIEVTEKDMADKYTHAVNQYPSSSNYLYAPYRRELKYYKLLQLIQNIVLLGISVFVADSYWSVIGILCTIGVNWLWSLWNMPFFESMNNVSMLISQASQIATCIIGILSFHIGYKNYFDYILIGWNGLNAGMIAFNILYHPIRIIHKIIIYRRHIRHFSQETNIK